VLGEHVDLLTGFPFKSAGYTENPSDVALLRGSNIGQAKLDWTGAKRWPRGRVEQFQNYLLEVGDVVLAMDRPWIEAGLKYAWIVPRDLPCLLVQRVARLRGTNGLLTGYLRLLLGSKTFTDYIAPIVTGVTVPHISPTQIKGFRFDRPPVDTQRRIVAILSAYDDLIENNTRRVQILEEIAQAIYREWFVEFRFPGHEDVPMIDSVLGPIPEGWAVRPLGEMVSASRRTLDPRKHPDESFAHFSIPAFDSAREPVVEIGGGIRSSKFELRDRCVLYAKLNPRIPRVWLAEPHPELRSIASTEFMILTPSASAWSLPLIWALCSSPEFAGQVVGMSGGTSTSHQRVRPNDLMGLQVVAPESGVAKRFADLAGDMLQLAATLGQALANLRATRAFLLPRLISGEVDVTDLDIEASGLVA
jgi:type I restriction enzyme, S subunit